MSLWVRESHCFLSRLTASEYESSARLEVKAQHISTSGRHQLVAVTANTVANATTGRS